MSDSAQPSAVRVEYFSDVLCVWAYTGQIRVDQLCRDFGEQVQLHYRFFPLFGAARVRIETAWRHKGGSDGFREHLEEVCRRWDHVSLHPRVWRECVPETSCVAHLFLKAVSLLVERGELPGARESGNDGRTLLEEFIWRVREAFFAHALNISLVTELDGIAREMGLPLDAIHNLWDSGEAHAALHLDMEAKERYRVSGSPTMVLNGGRQHLYGNVGYRIIEANVRELLHNPGSGEASWC